ncbi:hypothetical protein IQ07DRAFT_602934 [Pyrenochaeta sp. DS3sAY3a]|nr:hypothetical protein IQ07DRAFT_602934 [Pyrenochaeta sp. DS3sAY3a]
MRDFGDTLAGVISLLAISWLTRPVAAQIASSAVFAYPIAPEGTTPRLIVNYVDTIIVEWTSDFQAAWLYLYCVNYNPDDPGRYILSIKPVPTSGNTSYSPGQHLRPQDPEFNLPYDCQFNLNSKDDIDLNVNGPVFNVTSITSQEPTTYAKLYTTASASSTPTPTSSGDRTSGNPAPSTSTPSASPTGQNDNGSGGLSPGAKAGIGVGVALGVLALAGLAYFAWRNNRALKALQANQPVVVPAPAYEEYKSELPAGPETHKAEMPAGPGKTKLENQPPVELPTGGEENKYNAPTSRPTTNELPEMGGRS